MKLNATSFIMGSDLTQRFQKLESDINLITSIRDVLMLSNNNSTNDCRFELPERDDDKALSKRQREGTTKCKRDEALSQEKNNEKMEKELEKCLDEIDQEKRKRMEIEESAQLVAVQLQKTEDDLQREREIKKSLLVGTLEMKNQLQGYHSQIMELEQQIAKLKLEKDTLGKELRGLKSSKEMQIETFQHKLKEKEEEIIKLMQSSKILSKEIESLKKESTLLETENRKHQQNLFEQEKGLKTQLEQILAKSAHAENQQKKVEDELKLTLNKLETWKEKSKCASLSIKVASQKFAFQLKEKNEKIQSLESILRQERINLSHKIDSATNLVSKTKSFIISLQNEKLSAQNKANEYLLQLQKLQKEKESMEHKMQEMSKQNSYKTDFQERFWSLKQEYLKETEKLKQENEAQEENLRLLKVANEQAMKSQENLRTELENVRQKFQSDNKQTENESKRLRDELKRLTDNFAVLQKISEDQGKTISKQRNELDTASEQRHQLENKLRESHETEKALHLHLSKQEESAQSLELQVSHLEHQLSLMEKEVQSHDCDEFVDSRLRLQIQSLEEKVQNLETQLKFKGQEKDKAITAARKAVHQAEEIKALCDNKLLQSKSSSSQQLLKLQEEKLQLEIQHKLKMQESESEIAKLKEAFGQMQNGYMGKIQQLQSALCAVNTGPFGNFGLYNGFPNSNFINGNRQQNNNFPNF